LDLNLFIYFVAKELNKKRARGARVENIRSIRRSQNRHWHVQSTHAMVAHGIHALQQLTSTVRELAGDDGGRGTCLCG